MNKSWLPILCMLSLFSSCHKKKTAVAPPPPAVHAAAAQKRDEPITIETFGLLGPSKSAQIRPQVSGKLVKRLFEEGARVNAGELLYIIDPTEFEATARQKEADQKKAEAEVTYAREVLERNKSLATREYISQLEFEKFQQNIDMAEANLMNAAAAFESAQIELGYCYIKAPFTGTIGFNKEDPGNIVNKTETILTDLMQTTPLKVNFNVTDVEFEQVQAHMKKAPLSCTIHARGNPKIQKSGLLTTANNTIDTKTGTIHLQAVIDNEEALFWPGQYVNTSLILYVEKDACIIPSSATFLEGDKTFVYVIRQEIAHKTEVSISQTSMSHAIISEGIKEGDLVITDGQFNVSDNKPVRVIGDTKP